MVASLVELSFVAGVVPVEILLSDAAPVTTSVPPILVLPPILVDPPIPTPPPTISAPLFVALEAVALEIVVTPEILVAASVEMFCTVTLLSVQGSGPNSCTSSVNTAQNTAVVQVIENATVVPFVWEPIATEIYCEQKGFGEFVKRPIKKIATMEANISVMKHFLPTLVTVEELLDRGIDIEKHMIMGADHLISKPRVTQILRDKKLLIEGKISLNPRVPTQDMIHIHADLVLSWQWENNLNYLYFDAAWMGAPVVHNANLCPDLGYYYEGFQMYEAADVVEEAIKSHPTDETYLERNREVIKRYTHHNKNLIKQYNELLENLVNNKFVEMNYNWQDNSVSPK